MPEIIRFHSKLLNRSLSSFPNTKKDISSIFENIWSDKLIPCLPKLAVALEVCSIHCSIYLQCMSTSNYPAAAISPVCQCIADSWLLELRRGKCTSICAVLLLFSILVSASLSSTEKGFLLGSVSVVVRARRPSGLCFQEATTSSLLPPGMSLAMEVGERVHLCFFHSFPTSFWWRPRFRITKTPPFQIVALKQCAFWHEARRGRRPCTHHTGRESAKRSLRHSLIVSSNLSNLVLHCSLTGWVTVA
jgi:hypothetical protein